MIENIKKIELYQKVYTHQTKYSRNFCCSFRIYLLDEVIGYSSLSSNSSFGRRVSFRIGKPFNGVETNRKISANTPRINSDISRPSGVALVL